jgi:peptide-methionine (R)-S-oxide reductase
MRKFSKDPDAISRLSPEQYRVTQQNGTETPGTGKYLDNKQPGIYVDIVSGEPLFASSDKFEAGGLASPSPLNRQTSKSCETPRTA